MLGDVAPSWCPHCHCPPGPDCPDAGKTTRAAKRAEQRRLDHEFAGRASWHDTGEGKHWLEFGLAEAEGWPLYDFSDCQHGCNGDCVEYGGYRCNFTCHEEDR